MTASGHEGRHEAAASYRRQALTAVTLYLSALAAAFVLAVVYVVGYIPAYEPYEFVRYTAEPEMVCQGESVQVDVTRRIGGEHPIGESRVFTQWVRASDGAIYGDQIATLDLEPTRGVETRESPIIRTTPPDPGVWRIRTELTIQGRVGITPRSQQLAFSSDETVMVLPATEDGCNEGPGTPTAMRLGKR